ncbi:probable transcription factor At3g04930 [Telopea speciosissima]|uniref:probable transcription factor At3g04930 n=1 Tax=Telopea speciosissima TaxID=54955 RepID=UPI001CC34F9D|nr:probable transcription factor At3g04930 [Telopea speciosissima]
MSTPSTVPSSSSKEKKNSGSRDSGEKRRKRVTEPREDLRAVAPKNQQLFKRLFSEEDEIKLLNAFLDISKTAHASPSPANTAAQIFDKVGDSFRGLFTNKQLTDKLSKLRRKYAKQINNDKTPKTTHDWEVFHLSQKIWGNGDEESAHRSDSSASPAKDPLIAVKEKRKVKTGGSQASPIENRQGETQVHHTSETGKAKMTANASPAENGGETITVAVAVAVAGLALENFPFLMQEVSRLPWDAVLREGLRSLDGSVLRRLNEEWRLQHIAEVKVMEERAKLVQEQTKLILDAIDSSLHD